MDDPDALRGGTDDDTATTTVDAVTVREARLVIANDIVDEPATPAPIDAGDSATHRLVISHAADSDAPAFDAALTHPLPVQYENVTDVSAVRTAADGLTTSPVAGFSVSPDGRTLSHPDLDLALGETITVSFDATLTVEAEASTTVTDSASLSWQSLGEDPQGNQASQADSASQAALAADTLPAATPFLVSDSASFVVGDPVLTRTILSSGIDTPANAGANDPVDGTEVVPGERVVHELVVRLPEGTTRLASITETLADGLAFDPDFPVTVVASTGVSLAGDPGNATPDVVSPASADPGVVLTSAVDVDAAGRDTVTFDLGDLVNTDTDDTVPDTITIRYATFAEAGVVAADTLAVDSALRWDVNDDGDNSTPTDTAKTLTRRRLRHRHRATARDHQ